MEEQLIDAHVHCFPDHLARRAVGSVAMAAGAGGDGTLAGERLRQKEYGISKSVLLHMASRPDTMGAVNRFALDSRGEGICALGSVHPFAPDALEVVERLHALGVPGVKFHTGHQKFDFDDDRCRPLYRRIGALGMATVIHCGSSVRSPDHWVWPETVARVADCFQGAPLVCAHMGGGALDEKQMALLCSLPVYVDTALMAERMSLEEFSRRVRRIGPSRVLFGTDAPWGRTGDAIRLVQEAELTGEERRAIFCGNARRVFRID